MAMYCMPYNLCSGTHYFQYHKVLQTFGGISAKLTKKFLSEKFSSSSWLYSKNLVGHTGCVNALAFSNNGGEFLVSGGDDTKVFVWNLHEAVRGSTTARCLKQQHHSNIFCVTFDNDNRHIITAGNDEVILQHDFESGEVVRSFEAEAETNEICIHPEDNNVFIAAESSYGAVTLFDARTPTEQVILAVPWPVKTKLSECWPKKSNFSSAKFNPIDPTFIATGNLRNGVQLWDTRFPKRCLRHFDSEAREQCVMSIAFDQTGQYIAAVRKSVPPVLYHIDRDACLVKFYEKGYSNTVTRKSVCFAGLKDEFIITGSEDFKVYLWAVPKLRKNHNGVAKVEHTALALEGHRSIVNQVCFNQDTAMICTSGVEKIIKMWSPFPMVGGISGNKSCDKRKLYTRADYLRLMNNDEMNLFDDSTSEDQQMLAMVDQWLQTNYSSSDNESDEFTWNDGIAAEQEGRDNLSVQFSLFHEISDSPKSTDSNSEMSKSPDRNSVDNDRNSKNTADGSNRDFEKDSLCQTDSDNATRSERNSESAGSLNRYSRNTGGRDRNCESAESSDSNVERSEGIGLERLHEIISSQSRPRSTLGRIAQLRRNVLRNNENVSMFPTD